MTLTPTSPLLCAIDTTDLAQAKSLTRQIAPHVGGIKLGLEFFVHHGAQGVRDVAGSEIPVFLDLKFHDIPNTVAGTIRATRGIPCFMMTIHAAGGSAMMLAAKQAAQMLENNPKIVGVTVLTSMDAKDLSEIGVQHSPAQQVETLAQLAQANDLDGIVCSPHEISAIRARFGRDFTLVTPGIRPEGSAQNDQKRTLTPREALQQGSDYLVIGRPITQASNPAEAARAIAASL